MLHSVEHTKDGLASFPCRNILQSSSQNSALASCLHSLKTSKTNFLSSFQAPLQIPPLFLCPYDLIVSHRFSFKHSYASLIPDFCRVYLPHAQFTSRTHTDITLSKHTLYLQPSLLFWLCCEKSWSHAAPHSFAPVSLRLRDLVILSLTTGQVSSTIHSTKQSKAQTFVPWLSYNPYNRLFQLCPTLLALLINSFQSNHYLYNTCNLHRLPIGAFQF